ncbi:MAG: GlsB/YeaQ/YmgE family stress response membrane protein [Saccharofermentanales bacterium]
MEWLAWIVLGGLAGWVASIITRNNARMGLLANIIIGILGALAGNFLLPKLGVTGLTGFNVYSFFVAVAGAALILLIVNLIRGNRR